MDEPDLLAKEDEFHKVYCMTRENICFSRTIRVLRAEGKRQRKWSKVKRFKRLDWCPRGKLCEREQ